MVPTISKFVIALTTTLIAGNAYAGTITTITDPVATGYTHAQGINNSGEIVGTYADNTGSHGFVDNNNVFTTVDVPGSSSSTHLNGIDNAGQITGYYTNASNKNIYSFVDTNGSFQIFAYTNPQYYTEAESINSSGQVAGSYYDGNQWQGFIYTSGNFTLISIPTGGSNGYAFGINDAGTVTGYYLNSQNVYTGYQYSNGVLTSIADPMGVHGTQPYSILNSGAILGTYSSSGKTAFEYAGGLYSNLSDLSGLSVSFVSGNNVGGIVGYYSSAGNDVSFFDAGSVAVSEPASLAILFVALVIMAMFKHAKLPRFLPAGTF